MVSNRLPIHKYILCIVGTLENGDSHSIFMLVYEMLLFVMTHAYEGLLKSICTCLLAIEQATVTTRDRLELCMYRFVLCSRRRNSAIVARFLTLDHNEFGHKQLSLK